MKEVNVFSSGDSRKLSTWSNIPYFFTHTLEKHNIKVNRIDIGPNKYLKLIWSLTIGFFFKLLLGRNTTYSYFRSMTHRLDVTFKIKRALRRFSESEANIFLTFSFSSIRLSERPLILFGDWTYDYHFSYFAERSPDIMERQSIHREDANIEGADLVLPLFPRVAEHMKGRYKNKRIYYLGNVINSTQESREREILDIKNQSRSIVFIGSARYKEGLRSLIRAFHEYKKEYPGLELDVIGMSKIDFEQSLQEGVYCHGYLNKDRTYEREKYYQLIRKARILVNTTPKWGAFSSALEAMYHYTPVVVSPYCEFVETFGQQINFGFYCAKNEPGDIVKCLRDAFNDPNYESLCINANSAAKEHTWDAYISKMLKKVEDIGMKKFDST